MKNKMQLQTEEETTLNQTKITAVDILAEIRPLLDDYFEGAIVFDSNGITYSLDNGQKFIISVKEAA